VLASPARAAEPSAPSFEIRLEGVKFDYPGFEHWAEIECPDGRRAWVFARYRGEEKWRVPAPRGPAGTYRLLHVERRRGESREEDTLASDAERELTVSEPREPVRTSVGGQPLATAGEFKTFFAAEEPWCVNDHTFVQGPDQTWHLFGITHPKPLSWEKDPGRQLAHATAATLLQTPWDPRPFAVKRDLENYHEFLLWAPYVLRHEGLYYMYVCAGDPGDHSRYRIHLLTSPDLETWTRSPENPMVVDGFDARDPFVMRVDDEWVLYYTATSTPECGNHVVACVTSRDLIHWGNRRVVFIHPRAGSFGGPTESPFIVRRGDTYSLFVCDNEWTDVYVSHDPFHWEYDQKNTRIRAHAAEIVRDADGTWYISHAGWTSGPLKMAPLQWHDGLDNVPTNIQPANQP
jgi:beta-fructofuranosidase